jgi:transcriptional regulator
MSNGKERSDLVRGTLDLMILRTLELRPLHGIAVADRIRQLTAGTFDVPAGSLFPALHRLEQGGRIVGEWTTSSEGRRVRAYALTTAGRKQVRVEKQQWKRVVGAMARVLEGS